jgi:hypothetical protein
MGDYMREIEYWHRTWAKNTPRCLGYGEMEGKCDGIPMDGREYCFDCAVQKLEDERRKLPDESAVYGIDCVSGRCDV